MEDQLSPRNPVSNCAVTHSFKSMNNAVRVFDNQFSGFSVPGALTGKKAASKRAGGSYNLITLMVASASRIQKGENPIVEFSWTS